MKLFIYQTGWPEPEVLDLCYSPIFQAFLLIYGRFIDKDGNGVELVEEK